MKKEEALAIEHKKFRDKYRATTLSDWQTFQLGLEAGWEAANKAKQLENGNGYFALGYLGKKRC